MKPEEFYFRDDGTIPNNKLPLLLYRNAFRARGEQGAEYLETVFHNNNWKNSWRNGVYPFHHYHSTSHEVLGVYQGSAFLHLGGDHGKKLRVSEGDVIIIPAGVGHKNLGSENFHIVGAYPNGMDYDMNRGLPGERPRTDNNIAALPLPGCDPLGYNEGLPVIWEAVKN